MNKGKHLSPVVQTTPPQLRENVSSDFYLSILCLCEVFYIRLRANTVSITGAYFFFVCVCNKVLLKYKGDRDSF